MHSYTPPLADYDFILHDVLKVQDSQIEGYSDLERDFTAAILDEAGKLARDVFAPLNATGDQQGCVLENGVVRTPAGFKEAFDTLRAGGWPALDCDPEYGGQGIPAVLGTAVGEMHSASNMAFYMYAGLSHGAYSAIHAHGTEEQKRTYLPRLVTCEWTGTMNLTEPQAGTDLALLRTKAEPQDDGSYRISGEKIFISAGDHDLAENIIHLVLARIPGGPEGVKGISLFIVPKYLVDADGNPGSRNGVSCTKLEEKMGIHGNATCVMNYDNATGYLLGGEHKGLAAMFTMMNEARVSVGLQGPAQATIAYQNALAYCRERLQGRDVTGAKNPDGPADPLIVHPDVRRNLMEMKSFTEGARAMLLYAGHLIDASRRAGDAEAEKLISLLTPVIKGFLTDLGFDMTVKAQQLFGGHGYIEETGASQLVRDARIAMIYEGANGVQALDLVGRKLPADNGAAMLAFGAEITKFLKANADNKALEDFTAPLKAASKDMQAAVMFFVEEGLKNPNAALAGSYDFLHLMGHVLTGLMWARMAEAATAALEAGSGDTAFLETKLATGRFYMQRMLPETCLRLARIRSGADPVMTLAPEAF